MSLGVGSAFCVSHIWARALAAGTLDHTGDERSALLAGVGTDAHAEQSIGEFFAFRRDLTPSERFAQRRVAADEPSSCLLNDVVHVGHQHAEQRFEPGDGLRLCVVA